jgi:sulfoxide reductase heme-binding subunit YedZ
MVLVSLSVGAGLALAGRVSTAPGAGARIKTFHEALALTGLVAIVAHGALLLGDDWLRPGVRGILLPFALGNQPIWTGLGVIAGWLAAIIGLSFYVRRWIGVAAWRWLHRWTLLVYGLGLVHTLGSGTDAGEPWLLAVLLATATPIVFAGTARILRRAPSPARSRQAA